MTRDQNGTWEMESNDNFEGYMKALGKREEGSGGKGMWRDIGLALWTDPQTCVQLLPPYSSEK